MRTLTFEMPTGNKMESEIGSPLLVPVSLTEIT